MSESTDITEIRTAVRQLCAQYGEDYWLELDRTRGYPTEFVSELTKSGFLTVLIQKTMAVRGSVSTKHPSSWKKSAGLAPTQVLATRKCTSWVLSYGTVVMRRSKNTYPP